MQYKKEHVITVHSVLGFKVDPSQMLDPEGLAAVNKMRAACLKIGKSKSYCRLVDSDKDAYDLILNEVLDFLRDKNIEYKYCAMRVFLQTDVFISPINDEFADLMNTLYSIVRYVQLNDDCIESIPDVVEIETEEAYVCS